MANTLELTIITPSKTFYRGKCEIVIVPTLEGEEAFMANHAWAFVLLKAGEMWIREPGATDYKAAFIADGFADVKDTVTIFCDVADWREDIDPERAAASKADAEAWLNDVQHGEHEEDKVARAQVAITRAIERMKVSQGGFRDH